MEDLASQAGNWSYTLLGYEVIDLGVDRLYRYVVSEEQIGRARGLLYADRIPHVVRRRRGLSGLEIIATDRSESLESNLSLSSPVEAVEPATPLIPALLSSAARLCFLERGWRRGVGKLYSDQKVREVVAGGHARLYDAVRLASDTLGGDRVILFADYAMKAEFITPLDLLPADVSNRITWVKLMGFTLSFHIVDVVTVQESEFPSMRKLEKALSEFTGEEIRLETQGDLVYVKPHSLSLNEFLKREIETLSLDARDGRVLIPLPRHQLVPVASTENLSMFGKLPRFTVGPHERLSRVKEIAEEVDLDNLEYRGMKARIDTAKVVSLESGDYHLTPQPHRLYVKMINREAHPSSWRPTFTTHKRRCYILVELRERDHNFSGEYYQKYEKTCRLIERRFTEALYSTARGDKNLTIRTLCDGPELENLSEELSRSRDYDVVSTVLLYDELADPQGDLVGSYEYMVASAEGYPHVIDVGKIVRDVMRGESKVWSRVNSIVMNVLKDLAVRTGEHPFRISPPEGLEDYLVAGVDATVMAIKRGYLYLATTVVVLDPSGNYKVKFSGLGSSDIDALITVLENIKRDRDFTNKKLIVVLNRSTLQPVLREIDVERLLRDGVILASASKTHSYSRILKSFSGKVVNVDERDIGLLVKLGKRHFEASSGSVEVSRYLAITTSHPSGGDWDVGTIKPVLLNITGMADHTKVAEFLISLAHFARVSAYWAPSLPWPVQKANKLSRKNHRIINALSTAGRLVVPTESVLQHL